MSLQKPRILVVEDEPLIAIELADILGKSEWECIGPLTDLPSALREARKSTLDGAILDLIIDGSFAYSVAENSRLQENTFRLRFGRWTHRHRRAMAGSTLSRQALRR